MSEEEKNGGEKFEVWCSPVEISWILTLYFFYHTLCCQWCCNCSHCAINIAGMWLIFELTLLHTHIYVMAKFQVWMSNGLAVITHEICVDSLTHPSTHAIMDIQALLEQGIIRQLILELQRMFWYVIHLHRLLNKKIWLFEGCRVFFIFFNNKMS